MSEYLYDKVSAIYDLVRDADPRVVDLLARGARLGPGSRVVDLGCGTGSHAFLVAARTGASVTGVEPSAGMLGKAKEKTPGSGLGGMAWFQGSADSIPLADASADLVYMTDVVHHVPDLEPMFREISRVLAPGGLVAIASQSHAQIERRVVARFFPETAEADKRRYPTPARLAEAAAPAGISFLGDEAYGEGEPVTVDASFLELAERKGYSVLAAISDEAYEKGLDRLRAVLGPGPVTVSACGGTVHWLGKAGARLG